MPWVSCLNQKRLYSIQPAKLCLGPPLTLPSGKVTRGLFLRQLTPPPYSHPRSPVKENAILSRNLVGLSEYLTSILSSVWIRERPAPGWIVVRVPSPMPEWLNTSTTDSFRRSLTWRPSHI